MRIWPALALLTSALVSSAQAGGVALRWDACFGEGTSTFIKSFACNTNAGSEQLVGSFVLPQDMPEVTANEIVVDFLTFDPTSIADGPGPFSWPPIPEWWKFIAAGTCRRTAMRLMASNEPGSDQCPDWAVGQAVSAIGAYTVGERGPWEARMRMGTAVPQAAATSLLAGTEYFSFALTVTHAGTVGVGACAGCSLPIAIMLTAVKVVAQSPMFDVVVQGPVNGTDSNVAFWRPAPVPTHTTTWSALKALYR